ncbi:MAG: hypothetical protein ACYDB8_12325 [Acidiferrobacterales bacterium]
MTSVPLTGHELPIPAQEAIGGNEGFEFTQRLVSQDPRFPRQSPSFRIGEANSPTTQAFFKQAIFLP